MAIPASVVRRAAGIDLHEADAALDHAARHQTLAGEVGALFVIGAVQLLNVLRFAVQLETFRRLALHAVRELEALDARIEIWFAGVALEVLGIELADEIELQALLFVCEVVDSLQIGDWCPVRSHPAPLEDTGK